MERILGLLDTLESIVCDSFKIPFTNKIIISESSILQLIDKIRLVVQSEDHMISKQNKVLHPHIVKTPENVELSSAPSDENPEAKAILLIQQAYQLSKEIRDGADKYADEVLAKLEAMTTRILRTIKNGRLKLSRSDSDSQLNSSQDLLLTTDDMKVETEKQ